MIETRIRDGAERHVTIRQGLTAEKAQMVRDIRAYANMKSGKADRTVEVVEEYANDRILRMGRTARQG